MAEEAAGGDLKGPGQRSAVLVPTAAQEEIKEKSKAAATCRRKRCPGVVDDDPDPRHVISSQK